MIAKHGEESDRPVIPTLTGTQVQVNERGVGRQGSSQRGHTYTAKAIVPASEQSDLAERGGQNFRQPSPCFRAQSVAFPVHVRARWMLGKKRRKHRDFGAVDVLAAKRVGALLPRCRANVLRYKPVQSRQLQGHQVHLCILVLVAVHRTTCPVKREPR